MNNEITLSELLRWRLAQAEINSPPVPRAARLLELARPPWQSWPEEFSRLAQRLSAIQIVYGHAMEKPRPNHVGHPVPVLIAGTPQEIETSARVLYFSVRDGRLKLRFQLEAGAEGVADFEATFVADPDERLLFSAPSERSRDREYRVDVDLPVEVVPVWEQLRVTDRMPFRLILRPGSTRV